MSHTPLPDYRAQASAAADRITEATSNLNDARAARPEDTEGAAHVLRAHLEAIRDAALDGIHALDARIGDRSDV